MKKKVHEYDEEYKVSETASSYLQSGLDTANESVDQLKAVGHQLKQQSGKASDQTVRYIQAQYAL